MKLFHFACKVDVLQRCFQITSSRLFRDLLRLVTDESASPLLHNDRDDFVSAAGQSETLSLTGRPIPRAWRGISGSDDDAPPLRQSPHAAAFICQTNIDQHKPHRQHWPSSRPERKGKSVRYLFLRHGAAWRHSVTLFKTCGWTWEWCHQSVQPTGTLKSRERRAEGQEGGRMQLCSPCCHTNRLFLMNQANTTRPNDFNYHLFIIHDDSHSTKTIFYHCFEIRCKLNTCGVHWVSSKRE